MLVSNSWHKIYLLRLCEYIPLFSKNICDKTFAINVFVLRFKRKIFLETVIALNTKGIPLKY